MPAQRAGAAAAAAQPDAMGKSGFGALAPAPRAHWAVRADHTCDVPATPPDPVLVYSDYHHESHHSRVRDRRLRAGDSERSRAEAPRRGERRDPDVPVQAAGPGTVHAEEQEDLEAGGNPARDRLHLRPAVGAGEPPGGGAVRRRERTGAAAAVPRDAAAAARAPPARASRGAQHHPPQDILQPGAQKSHDTRKAKPARQADVVLSSA